jgi:hypothetical protein
MLAIWMYVEGSSQRSIGRILQLSPQTVANWITAYTSKLPPAEESQKPRTAELFEKGGCNENDGTSSHFRVAAFFVQRTAGTVNLYSRAYPLVTIIYSFTYSFTASRANPNSKAIVTRCNAVGMVCTTATFGNR